MRSYSDLSVREKLLWVSMLASLIALLFASGAFVVYDLFTYRETLQRRLETDAAIIGSNSQAALLYGDEQAARDNLKALQAETHVQAAAIYGEDRKLFAHWSRAAAHDPPSTLDEVHVGPRAGGVVIARSIVKEGTPLGTTVIEADLGELGARFRQYLIIVILLSLVSFVLALPITTRLQRAISRPILGLAETARIVSRDKDYSVRAEASGRDEIGQLVGTFNAMLEQIQVRDAELRDARTGLEQRVDARTADLQRELAERRRAEEALRRNELQLAEAQRLAHVGSWEWDVRENRLSWSAEMYRIYGLDPETFRASYEGFVERVHPDDRPRVESAVQSAGRDGGSFEFDHRIIRPDGQVRTIHAFGSAVHDASGELLRMYGTGQDVTERKLAEQERETLIRARAAKEEAEGAERRAALLANISSELSTSLAVETSLPRAVRLAVPQFADRCSVHLVDGEFLRLTAVADADPLMESEAWRLEAHYPLKLSETPRGSRVVASGNPEVIGELKDEDLRVIAKDDEHFRILRGMHFKSAIVVPLAARGPAFGVFSFASRTEGRAYSRLDLSLAEDIAGRIAVAIDNARLYREAQEANRLKDEFLATLSHELRTPLNSIVGWARMLRTGELDAPTAQRAVETIDRNAGVQAQLIEDILDVSRIIAGKLQLDVQSVDLKTVIESALDSVRPAATAKEIRLQTVLDPSAMAVSGDPARLQQVVWNLLSNAIKFTPRGGRVLVRLARVNSHVEIAIDDTGQGIESAFLPHVFERFRQADSSSTRSHGGLGLGLAIVKHLVELHGGRVEVESAGPGLGSTFRVNLPLRPVASTRGAKPGDAHEHAVEGIEPAVPARLSGVKILVVDDEPDTRDILATVLERLGARVIAASSAAEALVALDNDHPDVLISDIEMPGCDGYELIRRIRRLPAERGGHIPAAALTAYARAEDRLKALVAGFNIHMAKPVRPEELAAVAANLSGRRYGVETG